MLAESETPSSAARSVAEPTLALTLIVPDPVAPVFSTARMPFCSVPGAPKLPIAPLLLISKLPLPAPLKLALMPSPPEAWITFELIVTPSALLEVCATLMAVPAEAVTVPSALTRSAPPGEPVKTLMPPVTPAIVVPANWLIVIAPPAERASTPV